MKDPVVLQGTEINLPTSAIETLAPGLTAALPGEALALLNRPLIVSTILYEYPLDRWHRIAFPPNSAEAKRFGLSGDISDSVVTTLTVDSSDRKLAPKMNRFEQAHFVLDRPYEVVTPLSRRCGQHKDTRIRSVQPPWRGGDSQRYCRRARKPPDQPGGQLSGS